MSSIIQTKKQWFFLKILKANKKINKSIKNYVKTYDKLKKKYTSKSEARINAIWES